MIGFCPFTHIMRSIGAVVKALPCKSPGYEIESSQTVALRPYVSGVTINEAKQINSTICS